MLRGVAYSSLARRLFPLNSEFMTFLAKEGLHQVPFSHQMHKNGSQIIISKDWQIYTLNNRSIEAFLYKYMIFISGKFETSDRFLIQNFFQKMSQGPWRLKFPA